MGPGQLRLVNGTEATYTHADHLGSPVAATDAAGALLWRERYTPFGEKIDDPAANRGNTGFTGHLQDDATGLTREPFPAGMTRSDGAILAGD